MICRHSFQPADGHRTFLDSTAATGWLAGSVADTAENAWKHIGFAVFDVGVAEPPLGDQANVLGNVRMSGTGPLAIDYLVKVLGVGGVSRFHSRFTPDISLHPAKRPIPYLALA
jgi:hypothetical protein